MRRATLAEASRRCQREAVVLRQGLDDLAEDRFFVRLQTTVKHPGDAAVGFEKHNAEHRAPAKVVAAASLKAVAQRVLQLAPCLGQLSSFIREGFDRDGVLLAQRGDVDCRT